MSTYNHQKLLTDWNDGNISNDLATGQALQHLGLLYQAIDDLGQQVTKQKQETEALIDTVNALKQEQARLQRILERLNKDIIAVEGLNLTVYQLKDEVNSLVYRLGQDGS